MRLTPAGEYVVLRQMLFAFIALDERFEEFAEDQTHLEFRLHAAAQLARTRHVGMLSPPVKAKKRPRKVQSESEGEDADVRWEPSVGV